MTRPKILWGVCGIAHGHIFRQLPLIEHFQKTCDIVIYGYGNSYDYFAKRYANQSHITVLPVAVPFWVGNAEGLDFEATAKHPANQMNFDAINSDTMAQTIRVMGKPDLVISDYEPVSAQYAYAHNAPLVTLDQQSKYLVGNFPEPLNGQTYRDEVMRLRMLFPKAAERLACSFFNVAAHGHTLEDVTICPPVLGDAIMRIQRAPETGRPKLLVYLSSQQPFNQSMDEVRAVCAAVPQADFHIFAKGLPLTSSENISTYPHGDDAFFDVLAKCNGIVSTAGHSLASEAMHLGIPVYAVPLPLYEQQMNAHVIAQNGFGVSHPLLAPVLMDAFIENLPLYAANIAADDTALLRTNGLPALVARISRHLRP